MAVRSVVIAVLLGGCSVGAVNPGSGGGGGGVDASGGGGGGEASFTAMIQPLVTGCLGAGCHGAAQAPNMTSFAELQAAYKAKPGASNIFVVKGNATAGNHQGRPYFTAAQQTTVATWIDSL